MARDSSGRVAGHSRRPDVTTQGGLEGTGGGFPAVSSAAMRDPTEAKCRLKLSACSGGISVAASPPPLDGRSEKFRIPRQKLPLSDNMSLHRKSRFATENIPFTRFLRRRYTALSDSAPEARHAEYASFRSCITSDSSGLPSSHGQYGRRGTTVLRGQWTSAISHQMYRKASNLSSTSAASYKDDQSAFNTSKLSASQFTFRHGLVVNGFGRHRCRSKGGRTMIVW